MALRNLALLTLVVFSGQQTTAARIGPRKDWRRGPLIDTAASPAPEDVTDSPTSPTPSISGHQTLAIESEPSSAEILPSDAESPDYTETESPSEREGSSSTPDVVETTKPIDNPGCKGSRKHCGDGVPSDRTARSTEDEEEDTSPTPSVPVPAEEDEHCIPLREGEVKTVFSVLYTETITWTGDPADYTAPYPTTPIPTYCKSPSSSSITSQEATITEAPLSSDTASTSDDGWNHYCITRDNGTEFCSSEPHFNPSAIFSSRWATGPDDTPGGVATLTGNPLLAPPGASPTTSTFFITSRNPTVVFPPEQTPGYGIIDTPNNPDNGHLPAGGGNNNNNNNNPRPPYESVLLPTRPPEVIITADPTRVIIDDTTITNLVPGAMTTVTVGKDTYVINPSQIIQVGGQTVTRPGSGQGLQVSAPTSAFLDGLRVTVSGAAATIGGFTYTIPSTPQTEVVQGRTVVIGPTGITFEGSDESLTYSADLPEQTGIVVAGGEMMTAIGRSVVVIMETTITYGPGTDPRTEVVDDDTIVIGPSYVEVHETTIGGDSLRPAETRYDIVGGATLTQIGASRVEIRAITYTVGPGTGTTTTIVGGETITIAPDGITVATLTLAYPFGPTMVTTIPATPTNTAPSPADAGEDDEDAGFGLRPEWTMWVTGLCIAIGAWGFGYMT